MSKEKIKFINIKKSKGEFEFDKKVLKGIPQGSLVLNKAFGKITAHFHFMGTAAGDEIRLKAGDKIILEGLKLQSKSPSTHWGSQGLYKLPIMTSAFIGNCESIEEFESKCAALDGKKTLYGGE
jgi:nitrous oxidase accessory protein NosD|tara:strand:- start:230 stop:601 length:372 start_codon:yes stop_codon:yes gene_type:complete